MKKYLILLFFNFLVAQTNNSVAIYEAQYIGDFSEVQKGMFEEEMRKGREAISGIKMQLTFNDEFCETKFYGEAQTFSKALRFATAITGCREKTLMQLSKKQSFETLIKDRIFTGNNNVLVYNLDSIWTITAETKKIQEFTCIKATQDKITGTGRKYVSTAWFCPDLPFSFGPKQHLGLPGLILELTSNNILYGLKSLELNKNTEELSILQGAIFITEDEYMKKATEMAKEFEQGQSKY
jgi:GLPGLI family protein